MFAKKKVIEYLSSKDVKTYTRGDYILKIYADGELKYLQLSAKT